MKKHLEFVDESSDKFWEIETSGNSFTVTYGRNGTSGQSQTKTFTEEDKCIREAEKLIAEKIRKGYSEDGQVILAASKPKNPKQSDLQIVLDEYTNLLKTENISGLLPFLKNRTKGHTEELKKHIRKAKTYWLTYIDLSEESVIQKILNAGSKWGIRATPVQKDIIVLSAIGLFNLKDITSWDEAVGYFDRIDEEYVLEVLEWAKPGWIGQFLLDKTEKNDWQSVSYKNIRSLENKGLIDYHPELFVKMMTKFRTWNAFQAWKHSDYVEYIVNDVTAYERDVPQLFNYETGLQNQYFDHAKSEDFRTILVWERILNRLLSEKKLDRLWYIESGILIQTKEWNANSRSFFRKRLADCEPTAAELLGFQDIIFHCLHSPLNAVANFAIDLIKNIFQEKDFKYHDFLEWVEPVMMRVDCKGGIKTVLGIFDKTIKIHPEFKQKISLLTADVFVIADLTLQERAYKTLEKVSDANDHELKEKLAMYLPQIQGNIAILISKFVDQETPEISDLTESYQLVVQRLKLLNDEKRILPFETWNDILFQFGKFISSWEVIEGEKLVNAFITQQHLFPSDAAEQLQVYSNQLEKTYFSANDKNVISGMLVHIIEKRDGVFDPPPLTYRYSKIINLPGKLLLEAQKKMKAGFVLPLLSFPTHAPHWIDPEILVDRLIQYKEIGWDIDPLDFTIAISRMPRENTDLAIKLCDKLGKEEACLMKFALGFSDKIELNPENFLKKLFSGPKSENSVSQAIWAVAARTFYPEREFSEFENTSLKNASNVSSPLIPEAKIIAKRNEYKNYQTQEIEHYVFRELHINLPESQWSMPQNLLYSLDVFERKKDQYVYNFLTHGDVLYWHSLMPQNDQALSTILLKYSCKTNESGSDDLNAFLYLTAQPEFVFTDTSMFVFACCMFNKDLKTRSYTSEILIYLIEHKRITAKILGEKTGYLISENYGPVQRFIDVITNVRDVSGLHNSAILVMMDYLFLNFNGKDKLPVNFKKLLEFYLDLLMKTGSKPDEKVLGNISLWKEYNAIKSILKQIQNI